MWFRKRAKKHLPVLSAADEAICDEYEVAYDKWLKLNEKRTRATGAAEKAFAQAEYELTVNRWDAAAKAHKVMMERLTAEARAALTEPTDEQ
jgi:hypothetical protein